MMIIGILLYGALFGGAGQVIRAIIGLTNAVNAAPAGTKFSTIFNLKYFLITLAFGVAVGAITGMGTAFVLPVVGELTKQQIMLLVSSGYTGSDALQGLFSKFIVPSSVATTPVTTTPTT